MSTKIESEFPSSTPNDESDGEEECDDLDSNYQEEDQQQEEQQEVIKTVGKDVSGLLARLQSSGALLKKPKQEYHCFTCSIDFENWEDLENHLVNHVSLPSVVLDKLPSDDEDLPPSGDENWSDEEAPAAPVKPGAAKTPQKIDISQLLKKTGISLKKPVAEVNSSDSALNKLSGLGFTIKKNSTPIKKEKPDNEPEKQNDVMQKLGKLGGIKLKLKCDGNNTNSFKVVNGLKDFKTSDDEEEGSDNEDDKDDQESNDEQDKSGENDSDDHQNVNKRRSSDSNDSEIVKKIPILPKGVQAKIIPKKEPANTLKDTFKEEQEETPKAKPGRPAIKQTPKRGVVNNVISQEPEQSNITLTRRRSQVEQKKPSPAVTPETHESNEKVDNVVVKQEVADNITGVPQNNDLPLFSGQIKSERSTPPLSERTTPILARVKTEPEIGLPTTPTANTQPLFSYKNTSHATTPTTPLLPVTKTEDTGVTVIEINGDSNDEDDDCCVVSTTPAPVIKPKVEKSPPPAYPTPTYSTSQTSYQSSGPTLSSRMSTAPSTEKQHNFNWNAPDTKPPLDMLEKSADDIFESLLSTATKKENLLDASEYVSLDSLGPQHTCEICNTRFTSLSLLDDHRRVTGHCSSIISASPTSALMPYNHSSSILSTLLPVKQLAEQVGKLSGSSAGFTHQQNVMINIQAYPGGGGVMVPPQPYNTYPSGQNMPGNYPQSASNMYSSPGSQQMPNQYAGPNYMGQGYNQYPSPMSKAGYPGTLPQNSYSMASSPYSAASPLQSMQQSVYQTSMMNQPGAMGPPGSSPSHSYASATSPGGAMKTASASGIKIQNIQTFPPGQIIGQAGTGQISGELGSGQPMPGQVPGQISGPTPIRMAAGANVAGTRPRMPSVRGQRPTIRPGIQVHGQVRGGKIGPRMPMKRPGAMVGVGGPGQKRRPDMLLPGKHDNEDCQVMALQKQREGLPLIHSVQGAKDKLNIGSQISITKKSNPVNKEANAMANVLASRGISVKQKQKSRSPSPDRPLPHIPNLGAGMSIKHTSKSSKFSIPEAKVGAGMYSCKICKKMFMNQTSLQVHMSNAHPQTTSKIPMFKCDECPASYPKSLQLQHHKRVFHNVSGPNRELGLPVVDLSQEDNLKRLSNLGIYSFIPLANRELANGCFGIPVISVHNMQNGLTSSLQALGADGLLSLGPLKPLPN
ncbi:uncharacterized protein LOC112049108 [Bicyclus anynana]|uniref:Uncharacterized protein LOC112049108 n=1 Tax=Bicyclus anynana TaxID=110368 RepID=A0A6J1NC92_BICAN|nr:uncharacterized protein LOC112049108 [Bicyclus anynana]